MNQIVVSMYKNTLGTFYPSGCNQLVNCDATLLGFVYMATETYNAGTVSDVKAGDIVNEFHPVAKKKLLKVNDHTNGDFYIDGTPQTFLDKCNECCNSITVSAGADQATATTSASVTGTASEDNAGTLTYLWTFVSGPATPVIASPTALTTAVTGLTVVGSYVLKLTVTDAAKQQSSSDTVTIVKS